jgi:hypothetical protein
MFQHITVLFSFVFAIALTHVLSCASKLILARDSVRFSGLHALWLNALMLLLINWLSLWLLEAIKHWSVRRNHGPAWLGDSAVLYLLAHLHAGRKRGSH